jgi:hypothetical protein
MSDYCYNLLDGCQCSICRKKRKENSLIEMFRAMPALYEIVELIFSIIYQKEGDA